MAESQKETSSGQLKKKNSLLDLDFGNDDFLSSWKTVSIRGDETDLDFGSISKGKKNAFNFDKMDMDFNLDGDLGKIPSFNLDIPDIDISSPVKKDGKPKERPKESTSRSTLEKSDGFDFTFDFNDLDDFNFKVSSKKDDVKVKGGEDKEDSSNQMLPEKARDCLGEDVDAHQQKTSNLPISGAVMSSHVDLQGGTDCSPELSNINSPNKSLENDKVHLDSEAATDEGTSDKANTSLNKTGSGNNQEPDCHLDKSMSPESSSQEHSIASEIAPDQCTVPEVLEEVAMGDTEALTPEHSAETLIADSVSKSESPAWSGCSAHATAITEEKETGPQGHTDNDVFVVIKDGEEPVQSRIKDRGHLSDNVSPKLVPQKQENVKDPDLMQLSSTLNRAATNNLMPNKEREAVTRSKYFKQPEKTDPRFQNASSRTCSAIDDKATGTIQISPPDGSKKRNSVEATSDTRVDGLALLHSGSLIGKEHSRTQSWRSSTEVKKSSFQISTSSLSELTIKSSSRNSADPANLAVTMGTSENRKTTAGAADTSSVKATKHMPALSSLTALRTSGVNVGSSKSQPHKNTMLSRDLQQNKGSAGSTPPSRTVEVVEAKKLTPPAPSLKRKMNEACSTDLVFKPLKRFTRSPITRASEEISGKIVNNKARDKENVPDKMVKNACENQNNSNLASPNQVFMKELDVPSSLDYDSNIEMAEACSKGLEEICNLLSKKHEEAKELLVRAVVTNNQLLMLNHPIYEEKIRMVQKFAAQLTLREIHTQT